MAAIKAEMAALPEKPRDVVGDVRVCRYLRFFSGDVAKVSEGTFFGDFLCGKNMEKLRHGIAWQDEDSLFPQTYFERRRSINLNHLG